MTRSRQDVVAEIEALLVELSDLDVPDERGEGWSLADFMTIELWARINGEGEVEEAVTVNHRQRQQPRWRAHGLLLAAAEVVDDD